VTQAMIHNIDRATCAVARATPAENIVAARAAVIDHGGY